MRTARVILSVISAVAACACNIDGVIESPVGDDELNRRPDTPSSSIHVTKVFEYTPAPGQFINNTIVGGFDGSETTPEAAAAYAMRRMNEGGYVSLGAFGGYIIAGFDHSIENDGDYNIAITGNSFDSNSEPGIVYVMRDENGNGLPDDTWYELKGSEYGKSETLRDYSVTYYRPEGDNQPVRWSDSLGGEGEIDVMRLHRQASYYPAWIEEDSYTLTGIRLAARNYQNENGTWTNAPFEWGYADNFSPIDRLTDDDNAAGLASTNHFKISDAVDENGSPAGLKFIDFVKVQCALNTKSGALGECSTEVIRISDYNLIKRL